MFTGRYEPIPHTGEDATPSTWQSMSDAFKASYAKPFLLTPGAEPDSRQSLHDAVGAMESASVAGEQGLGQKSATWFSGLVGSVLNPASLALGEGLGSLAAKAVPEGASFVGRYLPVPAAAVATGISQKRMSAFLGEKVPAFVGEKTLGQAGTGAVKGFAMGTGFALPEEIANTYDPKQNTFNWWGGIKASFADGGVGLALMSVPYLAGTIWGKVFGRAHDVPMPHDAKPTEVPTEPGEPSQAPGEPTSEPPSQHPTLSLIDEAEASKKITLHEANWFRDYLTGKVDNKTLVDRATELLIKDGHPVNAATKRVLFELFKPQDIDNLQVALADGVASTLPENMKPLLHKFMINGKLDAYRSNTKMLNGLEGVVAFIKKRLEMRPEETIDGNTILRALLPESKKAKNPFSQHKIYQAVKAGKRLPVETPAHVSRLLTHDRKMAALKTTIRNYENEFKKTGKPKFKRLRDKATEKLIALEKTKPALLSHADEITHLRETLFTDGKLKSNFKASKAYQRLLDLTRVRNDARKLMHEVHLEHEYETHGHYANALDAITKVMRASVGKLADHNNVINYMKERIIRQVPSIERIESSSVKEVKADIKMASETESGKAFKDDAIKALDAQIKEAPDYIKDDFDLVKNKFTEFNENQGVFKNLIRCVQGAMDG